MDFIPNTKKEQQEMLKAIGIEKINDLFEDVPESVHLKNLLDIPKAMSELELKKFMTNLSNKNKTDILSFQGAGAYNHFIPSVVNHMISRSEFYTAYTPYQPEISQGILQAIFEYQTMICKLTGMDVTNASMYDGASALAETAIMCKNKTKRNEIIMSKGIHPDYREALKTYTAANKIDVVEIDFKNSKTDLDELKKAVTEKTAGVLIQSPNFFGTIEELKEISRIAKEKGAAFVVAVPESTSLGLLESPGSLGADIVVGEGQSFGNAMNFGGPYLGIIAVKKNFMRLIPGRLVGETIDTDGKKGYLLTLQAREQHIRREKASSNICSNEALCALAATIYLSTIGKKLKDLAKINYHKAHYACKKIKELNNVEEVFKYDNSNDFYNEFAIKIKNANDVFKKAAEKGIVPGVLLETYYPDSPDLKNCILINVTEMISKQDIDKLLGVLR